MKPLVLDLYMVGIPKYELAKVRGIVTTATYVHQSMMMFTRYLENNLTTAFNYKTIEQRDTVLNRLIQGPVCALDQSGFDHNLSLLQIITLAETLPYNEFVLEMLIGRRTSVQVGTRSVIMNNGISSGLPFTSAMGSYINTA